MVSERQAAALPFAVFGAGCVVAGGLVAAATASAPTEHGTWAAAYLVLVAGVSQMALGVGQAALAARTPTRAMVAAEFAIWNLGNAAVITGTLLGLTTMIDVGGAFLVVALGLLLLAVRGTAGRYRWSLLAFRLLVVVLLVSIPVGLVLARVRGP